MNRYTKKFTVRYESMILVVWVALTSILWGSENKYLSHPPMRPLPTASHRPMGKGPAFFVDPAKGDDKQPGSKSKPWKTLGHSVKQLKPGDTLYLRGGTYHERVVVTVSGTPERPITIRSYRGELAILDAAIPEFFQNPATAWDPCKDGAAGEFVSRNAHPGLQSTERIHAHVSGIFADSMVPLHAYRFRVDLQSTNVYWNPPDKMSSEYGFYCGPGVWYDMENGRIHVRLAPTMARYFDGDNYAGETDPRKLPLLIYAGVGSTPLKLQSVNHLRLEDIVIRAGWRALDIHGSTHVELDGLTIYSGAAALTVEHTRNLRVQHSAFRGPAAPWSSRSAQKYRGRDAKLVNCGLGNQDIEIGYCEITDCHDGLWVGYVKRASIHHSLIENVNDDAVMLSTFTDNQGEVWGGNIQIFQNRFSRCLSSLVFGYAPVKPGGGVFVYRNVFDLRRPIPYGLPASANDPQEISTKGRVWGDHGSPVWEPLYFYHNTVVTGEAPYGGWYAAGLASHAEKEVPRRIFNNIFMQMEGMPGQYLPPMDFDFQIAGNLNWSFQKSNPPLSFQPMLSTTYREMYREQFEKKQYPPAWKEPHGLFADPTFIALDEDWRKPTNLSLQQGSPAIDAGAPIPTKWPDPLRKRDKKKPDAGAIPFGCDSWSVGVHERLSAFGGENHP